MVCYDAISMACSISLKFCKMVKECFYKENLKNIEKKMQCNVIVCLIEFAIVRENDEKNKSGEKIGESLAG